MTLVYFLANEQTENWRRKIRGTSCFWVIDQTENRTVVVNVEVQQGLSAFVWKIVMHICSHINIDLLDVEYATKRSWFENIFYKKYSISSFVLQMYFGSPD